MRRRDVIVAAGGTVAIWPRLLRAREKPMPVIGFLGMASPGPYAPFVAAFRQGLSETGYIEGQNVAIEYRWAEGRYDRLPALAADLVGRKVDVIATSGGPASARAAKDATSTIPIVVIASDPVELGLVASFDRPGGNLTGVSTMLGELTAKRLELLSELVPQAKVIVLLVNPINPNAENIIGDARKAAREKGLQLHVLKAESETEIDTAFVALANLRAGALLLGNDAFLRSRRDQLLTLASRYAIPMMSGGREFTAAGGLISYGPRLPAVYRQLGIYAGRILKGSKPADLPMQQPTTFELVINVKTARVLGLTVPQALIARADDVIE